MCRLDQSRTTSVGSGLGRRRRLLRYGGTYTSIHRMRMDWGLNPCGTPWLDAIFNGDLNQFRAVRARQDHPVAAVVCCG